MIPKCFVDREGRTHPKCCGRKKHWISVSGMRALLLITRWMSRESRRYLMVFLVKWLNNYIRLIRWNTDPALPNLALMSTSRSDCQILITGNSTHSSGFWSRKICVGCPSTDMYDLHLLTSSVQSRLMTSVPRHLTEVSPLGHHWQTSHQRKSLIKYRTWIVWLTFPALPVACMCNALLICRKSSTEKWVLGHRVFHSSWHPILGRVDKRLRLVQVQECFCRAAQTLTLTITAISAIRDIPAIRVM